MANKGVNIKIKADTQQAEKGINNVTSKLNTMSKDLGKNDSLKKLQQSWDGLKNTITSSGLGALIAAEIGIIKKQFEFIQETTEAYNTQLKAEVQLQTAAKNNPYLNGESVKNLQNFASTVQSYTTLGDEYLMPFMAELASAGRTEQEIMDIITASADIAAGGVMDFGAAVSSLNATFNGTTGTLGKQVSAIKNLTKEQLANGEAIKIAKENYKGLAEEVTKATGIAQQSSNTWGDLKEEIGKITKPSSDKWFTFWNQVGAKGIEVLSKWNSFIEGKKTDKWITSTNTAIEKMFDSADGYGLKIIKATKALSKFKEDELLILQDYFNQQDSLTDNQEAINEAVAKNIEYIREHKKGVEENSKAQDDYNKKQKAEQETREKNNKLVQDALDAYNKTVKAKEREIESRRQLGEEIDKEKEAQELLNTKMSAYETYWKSVGSLGKTVGENLREDIKKTADEVVANMKTIGDVEKDIFALSDEADEIIKKFSTNFWNKDTIAGLESQKDKLNQLIDVGALTEEQMKNASEAIRQIDYEIEKLKLDPLTKIGEAFQENFTNINDTITTLCDSFIDSVTKEAEISTAKVEEQYEKGLISKEEYEQELQNIEKEAAKEKYKYEMWEWSANLLKISTDTAVGMMKAFEAGPIAGPILAATVGTLGAAQLAVAVGNKPIYPSFASGGIVPGSSFYGDKVKANVNSGEMILNTAQQKELWNLANGTNYGNSNGLQVNIKNYIGETANVTTQMQNGQLEVYIKSVVSDGLNNGIFDDGIFASQNRQEGTLYQN